jgi:hypothetical protein
MGTPSGPPLARRPDIHIQSGQVSNPREPGAVLLRPAAFGNLLYGMNSAALVRSGLADVI